MRPRADRLVFLPACFSRKGQTCPEFVPGHIACIVRSPVHLSWAHGLSVRLVQVGCVPSCHPQCIHWRRTMSRCKFVEGMPWTKKMPRCTFMENGCRCTTEARSNAGLCGRHGGQKCTWPGCEVRSARGAGMLCEAHRKPVQDAAELPAQPRIDAKTACFTKFDGSSFGVGVRVALDTSRMRQTKVSNKAVSVLTSSPQFGLMTNFVLKCFSGIFFRSRVDNSANCILILPSRSDWWTSMQTQMQIWAGLGTRRSLRQTEL